MTPQQMFDPVRDAKLSLGDRQRKFAFMIAMLIGHAYAKGYALTFGDAYRDPSVHGAVGVKKSYSSASSLHKDRLAVDFNLFKDGVYLTRTEDHLPLGEYWESIGGSWGGRFGAKPGGLGNDGNHYSLEFNGRK